jgi:hypothetical protein
MRLIGGIRHKARKGNRQQAAGNKQQAAGNRQATSNKQQARIQHADDAD